MKMQTQIVNTSCGSVEYSIYGKGEPILFLHGGHSNAHELLTHKHINTEKFILITPSRPGYGQTVLNNNKTPVNASHQIMELMDILGFAKFNVIGISAGGLTAIALVSLNQKRVLRFVLASAISKQWLKPTDRLYIQAKIIFNPKIERLTWKILRLGIKAFPESIIKFMAHELTNIKIRFINNEEVLDMKTMLLSQKSKKGFITDIDHVIEPEFLSKIKVPTLVIHSKNDKSVSTEHAILAHENIEKSKLVLLENKWGHLIWIGKESKKNMSYISAFMES